MAAFLPLPVKCSDLAPSAKVRGGDAALHLRARLTSAVCGSDRGLLGGEVSYPGAVAAEVFFYALHLVAVAQGDVDEACWLGFCSRRWGRRCRLRLIPNLRRCGCGCLRLMPQLLAARLRRILDEPGLDVGEDALEIVGVDDGSADKGAGCAGDACDARGDHAAGGSFQLRPGWKRAGRGNRERSASSEVCRFAAGGVEPVV